MNELLRMKNEREIRRNRDKRMKVNWRRKKLALELSNLLIVEHCVLVRKIAGIKER